MENLAQAEYLALLAGDRKSWLLMHVDLLLQVTIEECRLDIHVMDTPALQGS
jgi:hypothetical protein